MTTDKTYRIAVDAMGGDNAPAEIVAGAIDASKQSSISIQLVGVPQLLEPELAKYSFDDKSLQVIPAKNHITENEHPAVAMRQKPKSSIIVSTSLIKRGVSDANVSMGSSGATMAAATIILGTLNGIERPAIGGPLLGFSPNMIILDAGANVDCKPSQLLSFAIMGEIFSKYVYKTPNPRVALLSVGSEDEKGNKQVKETSSILKNTSLNFIGNVEANDLIHNPADVVVCDGFVGNILMKLTEGLGGEIAKHLSSKLNSKLNPDDIKDISDEIYNMHNIAETKGGGPLFGVDGVSIIGHGKAKSDTVSRAIQTAKWCVEIDLVSKLKSGLSAIK
ncbi:phosphate acyltransferase PlsX [bacterium]|nr:phosphate acyltransferase PlsX [bacterium]